MKNVMINAELAKIQVITVLRVKILDSSYSKETNVFVMMVFSMTTILTIPVNVNFIYIDSIFKLVIRVVYPVPGQE